jgi:hypothetical protein
MRRPESEQRMLAKRGNRRTEHSSSRRSKPSTSASKEACNSSVLIHQAPHYHKLVIVLHRKRQKAAQDEFLAVKGLGEADEEDDMQSWVEKQRVADVARRAEERHAARMKAQEEAAKRSRRDQEAGRGSDDDEAGANGHSLEGMKVSTHSSVCVRCISNRGLIRMA